MTRVRRYAFQPFHHEGTQYYDG